MVLSDGRTDAIKGAWSLQQDLNIIKYGKASCLELGDGNAFHVENVSMVQNHGQFFEGVSVISRLGFDIL